MPALEPHEQLELEWKLAQMEADVAPKKVQKAKTEQELRYEPIRMLFGGMAAGAGIMAVAVTLLGIIVTLYLRSH